MRVIIFFLGCFSAMGMAYGTLQYGIENITPDFLAPFAGLKAAVFTNQTGVTHDGESTIDVLARHGIELKKIFTPEHGMGGDVNHNLDPGEQEYTDEVTGLPVYVMHNHTVKDFTRRHLRDVQVIFFDVQDVGMRHFTYIASLKKLLEAAGKSRKKVVVFDRPNPLGRTVEGPLVDADKFCALSCVSIPLRHGLTIGEVAQYLNTYVVHRKPELCIARMSGYDPAQPEPELVAPISPGLKNANAVRCYMFTGMLGELTPLFVGQGTSHRFASIMLPTAEKVSSHVWQATNKLCQKYGIATSPCTVKNKQGQQCTGLALEIPNAHGVPGFAFLLDVVTLFRTAGISFTYHMNMTYCIGTNLFEDFAHGRTRYEQFAQKVNNGLREFKQKADKILLYDYPLDIKFL